MPSFITLTKEEMKQFAFNLLIAGSSSVEDATIVSDSLIWADLRGRDGYGVSSRLPNLMQRLSRGLIRSPADIRWETVAPAAHRLDAGHAFGHVAARLAMDKAIKVSQTQGVGLVAVRHSNHYGTAAEYCAQAAEAGCIGFTCTNAFPKVAPFGGKRPVLGTNPLGFGCPTSSGVPILVDMSTAAFVGSSVRKSTGAGTQLPPGVALDADGQPTTDPSATVKGCLLPSAGPKGFGLALMVEILSGLLSGAAIGQEVGSLFNMNRPVNIGHFFIAIQIDHFMPRRIFLERLQTLLGWIAECPRQKQEERIRFPGELRGEYKVLYERNGIPVEHRAIEVLNRLADEFNVKHLVCCNSGS